jgi:hypothetical protein
VVGPSSLAAGGLKGSKSVMVTGIIAGGVAKSQVSQARDEHPQGAVASLC